MTSAELLHYSTTSFIHPSLYPILSRPTARLALLETLRSSESVILLLLSKYSNFFSISEQQTPLAPVRYGHAYLTLPTIPCLQL